MKDYLRKIFELQFFGVCQWWGEKLGLKSSRIRIFFIYSSFIALGSPLLIYLTMAFLLENKDLIKGIRKRKGIWDL